MKEEIKKLKKLVKAVIASNCTEFVWNGLTFKNNGSSITAYIELVEDDKTGLMEIETFPYEKMTAKTVANNIYNELWK